MPVKQTQWPDNRSNTLTGLASNCSTLWAKGASGVIYRANRQLTDSVLPVAVKIFKGAMTSDGLPRSEKSASIAAGEHPGLIRWQEKLADTLKTYPDW